ncbi:MAG TPA: Rnase Y domain-containing protein, partial [Candidatus Hydrogenedentes bacterium]|nr:Rnase Y domain-containing protein [Candidatus Hydrogenedentota bacterium]
MDPLMIVWVAVAVVIGILLSAIGSRIMGRRYMSTARREAAQAISDAEREAATILKEAQTELKEQRIELRAEVEREAREQRRELVALEKRILAKEESVDKRVELLETKANEVSTKDRELAQREQALENRQREIDQIIQEQRTKLENVSGMSAEQAKRELFTQLENEVRRDTALRLKRIEDELVENSEKRAQWVISQAIQRCAADHVAESTVSVVDLPNDEMKGRIIGREGRNIRALESVTGINIIID